MTDKIELTTDELERYLAKIARLEAALLECSDGWHRCPECGEVFARLFLIDPHDYSKGVRDIGIYCSDACRADGPYNLVED